MDGLPFLPGNTFNDPTRSRYHKTHSLIFNNGYAQHRRPEVGIGGVAIAPNQLNEAELDELLAYKPELTYGQAKQPAPEPFVPAHAMWDKKVMKFYGWFKQTVHESQDETHRVRHVQLYYYLEDDSIAVIEPHVENSGLPQGKLIKRQRLPKNNVGDHWHWKDLNIGVNVVFYGKVFHIYDCISGQRISWNRKELSSIQLKSFPRILTSTVVKLKLNYDLLKLLQILTSSDNFWRWIGKFFDIIASGTIVRICLESFGSLFSIITWLMILWKFVKCTPITMAGTLSLC
jgi:hypothetical protein